MKVHVKQIYGNWDLGFALDKHMARSSYLGDDEHGHPRFDSERTEVGEAVYQLKYKSQFGQVEGLATAVFMHIVPRLGMIGLVVPMPASNARPKQPVHAVAASLAKKIGTHSFEDLLVKKHTGQSLKNLATREEKDAALKGKLSVHDGIAGSDRHNVLLLDDLFDSGASMEAACAALRNYAKIDKVFVAALTWK